MRMIGDSVLLRFHIVSYVLEKLLYIRKKIKLIFGWLNLELDGGIY